jgi:c-di-GMP-related signal transduction protein
VPGPGLVRVRDGQDIGETIMQVYMARQPIFDRELTIFGYEMLYRSGRENHCQHDDGDLATQVVINNTLHTFGWEAVAAGRKAFFNITRNILLSELLSTLPSQKTVVEILETVTPDEEVVAACKALKASGYLLALDDFVLRDELAPLIDLADIIKIDFCETRYADRAAIQRHFEGTSVKLLAEKVEDQTAFRHGFDLGYQYFQGYFFCRPQLISGMRLPMCLMN